MHESPAGAIRGRPIRHDLPQQNTPLVCVNVRARFGAPCIVPCCPVLLYWFKLPLTNAGLYAMMLSICLSVNLFVRLLPFSQCSWSSLFSLMDSNPAAA